MSKDFPDFMGGDLVSDVAPAAEAPAAIVDAPAAEAAPAAPAAEAAPAGPERGPDGKFLPKAEAAPVEPVVEAAPAAPAPVIAPEPNHAPLAALLDERDKRQAAEARANEAERKARDLETWRQQQEAAATRRPVPTRDEDPEGYEAHRQAQIDSALYDQRIEMSRGFAEMRHGPEVAKAAVDWGFARCDQDPHFNEKVRTHRDPIGFVVAEYQREQTLGKLGDPAEIDRYLAWKAAQATPAPVAEPAPLAAPAQSVAAPPPPPAAPRPSLAAAPSAAGTAAAIPRDGEAAWDAMFRR